jgi:hypothetical protein
MDEPEDRFKHVIFVVTTFLKVKQPENNLLFTVKLLVYVLNTNYIDLICLAVKQIFSNYSKLNINEKKQLNQVRKSINLLLHNKKDDKKEGMH